MHAHRPIVTRPSPFGPLPGVLAIAAVFAAFLLLSGCSLNNGEEGSGVEGTRTVELANDTFAKVSARDIVEVTIVPTGAGELTITGDDNLLDNVTVTVEGDTLRIGVIGNVNNRLPLRVLAPVEASERYAARDAAFMHITVPVRDLSVVARDAADVEVAGVSSGTVVFEAHDASEVHALSVDGADTVVLEARDASFVRASGTCGTLVARVHDASDVRAGELACLSADVYASDASDAEVCAAEWTSQTRDASRAREVCNR